MAKFTSTNSVVSTTAGAEDPKSSLRALQRDSLWTSPRLVPWTECSLAVS